MNGANAFTLHLFAKIPSWQGIQEWVHKKHKNEKKIIRYNPKPKEQTGKLTAHIL